MSKNSLENVPLHYSAVYIVNLKQWLLRIIVKVVYVMYKLLQESKKEISTLHDIASEVKQ